MSDSVRCPNCEMEELVYVRVVAIKERRVDGSPLIPKGDQVATGWFCQLCRTLASEEEIE